MGCKRGSIGFFQETNSPSQIFVRPTGGNLKFGTSIIDAEGCWKGSEYTKVNIKREYIHRRRERI